MVGAVASPTFWSTHPLDILKVILQCSGHRGACKGLRHALLSGRQQRFLVSRFGRGRGGDGKLDMPHWRSGGLCRGPHGGRPSWGWGQSWNERVVLPAVPLQTVKHSLP